MISPNVSNYIAYNPSMSNVNINFSYLSIKAAIFLIILMHSLFVSKYSTKSLNSSFCAVMYYRQAV
jgi:hypothetical protein